MGIESFTGSSATFCSQYAVSHSGGPASIDRSGRTGPPGNASLDDLISGDRPELNDLIGHHAANAGWLMEVAAKGDHHQGRSDLRDLLQKVLEDGTITPDEIEQLKQAMTAHGQSAGAAAAESHACPYGGPTDSGTGPATTTMDDPMTPSDPNEPTGSEDPAVAQVPPDTTSAAGNPAVAAADPFGPAADPVAPAADDFSLGSTGVRIKGGSAAQETKTRDLFEQMYQKNPEFAKGIDSKSASGLDVTIEDLAPGIQGVAVVGGNAMSLDFEFIGDLRNYANTIAHEFAHNLGQSHGAPLEAFAAQAAAVIV